MYIKEITEKRLGFLKNQLETIQDDFRENLKPKLCKYEYNAITDELLYNIQREIDYFLERNNLKINVYLSVFNQNIIIVGRTLIDEIVWEAIQ